MTDRNVFSPRLDRYFRCAVWLEILAAAAIAFVWYCYILTLEGRPSPFRHLAVRILIGAVGGAAAWFGIILSKGMWTFWKEYDRSSAGVKTIWFWVMTICLWFGSAAYYHLVYRDQLAARERNVKSDQS
jgi:RsiW-degrading membrane proteinase PrsW (M82 family)